MSEKQIAINHRIYHIIEKFIYDHPDEIITGFNSCYVNFVSKTKYRCNVVSYYNYNAIVNLLTEEPKQNYGQIYDNPLPIIIISKDKFNYSEKIEEGSIFYIVETEDKNKKKIKHFILETIIFNTEQLKKAQEAAKDLYFLLDDEML
jgi:hypothetical protein